MALEMTIKGQGTFRFPNDTSPEEAEKLIRRDFPDMFKNALPLPGFVEKEQTELRRHEGVVLSSTREHKSYQDNRGFLTGGVGHLLSDTEQAKYPEGTMIPDKIVNDWFTRDTKEAEKSLDSILKEKGLQEIPDEAKQILFNMTFNLGKKGIQGFERMWMALSRNDFEQASNEMKQSRWFEQVKSRGVDLTLRMAALSNPAADLPGTKFANRETVSTEEEIV